MSTFVERFALVLKNLKGRKPKIHQSNLAGILDVSHTAVTKWKKGANEPSGDNLQKIAELAGVNYEWLARGTGDMNKSLSVGAIPPPEVAAETWGLDSNSSVAVPASRALLPIWSLVDKGYEVMLLTEDAVRYSEGPPLTGGRVAVFGAQVSSDDMVPVIRPGATIWIETSRQASAPEVALFVRLGDHDNGRQCMVREIVKKTPDGWLVRRYGDRPADYELKRDEWEVMRIASIEPL